MACRASVKGKLGRRKNGKVLPLLCLFCPTKKIQRKKKYKKNEGRPFEGIDNTALELLDTESSNY